MKYRNRNTEETTREIKITMRSPKDEENIFINSTMINGMTERAIILAVKLVSKSVVTPQPVIRKKK